MPSMAAVLCLPLYVIRKYWPQYHNSQSPFSIHLALFMIAVLSAIIYISPR